MKKLIFVLVAALMLAAGVSAQAAIYLGEFPVGKWIDEEWSAVWNFDIAGIRIETPKGKVLWDFSEKELVDFNVSADAEGIKLTFACPAAGRKYTFMKPVTENYMTMEIEREGRPLYLIDMPAVQ